MKRPWSEAAQPRVLALGGLLLLLLLAWFSRHLRLSLGRPALLTGWSLFLVMVGLAAYNGRKRLSMLPLGSSAWWLQLHVMGGLLALGLFWLHTGSLWPHGFHEQCLAGLFYGVSLSGVAGHVLQRVYPRLLTNTRVEVIYERLPNAVAAVREKAETVVLNCTRETGSDTLARHYVEALDWYFRRPRFVLWHALGSERAQAWQQRQCATVRRYLNEGERKHLAELAELADAKTKLDFHYAAQSVLKLWLLVHVPLAAAVMALALWHIVVVHVYAL